VRNKDIKEKNIIFLFKLKEIKKEKKEGDRMQG